MIPHFVASPTIFFADEKIASFLGKLGLEGKKIVVCVGVIQRAIKRVDYVIEEIAALDDSWALVLCGDVVEPELIELAKLRLGGRVAQVSLPHEEMGMIYQAADLLVFASNSRWHRN